MLLNWKMFLSLLAVLALVGCNGDEGDDEGDYTLKVGSIDDIDAGGSFSVPVEIQSDKKTVVEGDGATLEVTVAVNCTAKETTDKNERKEVKPDAKKATKGKVTITGTADASWKAEDSCTAKATAKGAKEAEGKFKIKAASEEKTETTPPGTGPSVAEAVVVGKTFKVTGGSGAVTLNDKGDQDCEASLFYYKDATDAKPIPAGDSHKDSLFVVGETRNCVLKVGNDEVKHNNATFDFGDTPPQATLGVGVAYDSDNIKVLGVDASNEVVVGITFKVFAKAQTATDWTQIGKESSNTNATWQATGVGKGHEGDGEALVYFAKGTDHWLIHKSQ